jgi:hypothetical protein
MAFKRFGTPEPLKVVTVCEECKQDRPLMKVTNSQTGETKQLCGECVKKWLKASKDTPQ